MKKYIISVLVLLLLWPTTLQASTLSEKEPNHQLTEATDLGTVTEAVKVDGTLSDASDVDFYKVQVERGVLTIEMNEDTAVEWDIKLYDEQQFPLQKWYVATGKKERVFVCAEGVAKGTYFIKISRHSGEVQNSRYQLNVNWRATTDYEQEFNDGKAVAQPLEWKKPMSFFLDDLDRQDVFRVAVKQKGFVTFSFTHLLNETYHVEILTDKEVLIDRFVVNPLDLKGLNPLAKHGLAPGNYYIYVYATSEEAIDFEAQVQVDFTPATNVELEPNGNVSQASLLKIGVASQGTIYENSDVDVYKLVNPVKGKRMISVSFKQSGTVMMYVYAGSKVVTTLQFDGKATKTLSLGKGTYYFMLEFYPSNDVEAFYSLRVK